ncbi:MAG TPA: hypothetical protein VJJ22_04070 [Candidatus Paceibacterota bacterium]
MIDTNKYRKLLEGEKKRLEEELGTVGEIDPNSKDSIDWEPTPPPDIEHEADPMDQADDIEEYVERVGIEAPLEQQLDLVNKALDAIKTGTYGTCLVGDTPHPIEEGRLDANPSALTCIEHMG